MQNLNLDRFKFRAWCQKTVDNQFNYAIEKANKICNVDLLRNKYGFDRVYDLNKRLRERYMGIWKTENSESEKYSISNVMFYTDMSLFLPYQHQGLSWMQSTGLKDKNGKLIYEGDIVRIQMRTSGELKYYTFTIKWNGRCCAFEGISTIDDELFLIMTVLDSSEILGNIHENPELLKTI
jgi:uncharacterized phage protein (TIGR01671 family)